MVEEPIVFIPAKPKIPCIQLRAEYKTRCKSVDKFTGTKGTNAHGPSSCFTNLVMHTSSVLRSSLKGA
jgi:hypothetical protein